MGNENWTTSNEIHFLNKIGTRDNFAKNSLAVGKTPRIKLLQKYLKSCVKRKDWGLMDKKRIVSHVKLLINLELMAQERRPAA